MFPVYDRFPPLCFRVFSPLIFPHSLRSLHIHASDAFAFSGSFHNPSFCIPSSFMFPLQFPHCLRSLTVRVPSLLAFLTVCIPFLFAFLHCSHSLPGCVPSPFTFPFYLRSLSVCVPPHLCSLPVRIPSPFMFPPYCRRVYGGNRLLSVTSATQATDDLLGVT